MGNVFQLDAREMELIDGGSFFYDLFYSLGAAFREYHERQIMFALCGGGGGW
jgi:hypothetical protein